MTRARLLAGLALLASVTLVAVAYAHRGDGDMGWTDRERALIASLSLDALPPLPPDPSNRHADDPDAARLGAALFSDPRLSVNGKVSCASCHLPDRQFQDDLALGRGVGQTARRTMPIAGTAYSPWLFWDGRKDSLWSQALGPLESPVEHGFDRTAMVHVLARYYRADYERVFGPLPETARLPAHAAPGVSPELDTAWESLGPEERNAVDRAFSNAGKAIAAFERTNQPGRSRFDRYAAAIAAGDKEARNLLTAEEKRGLRLFMGAANCVNCHNGPLLTDMHFHNTGVPSIPQLSGDSGRALGAQRVRKDPFNCLGPYSDAAPNDCAELRFIVADGPELLRAYKTPSLRNVALRPPYMHAGQFRTLSEVLDHYDRAPEAPAGHSELLALRLADSDRRALEAFLHSLNESEAGRTGGDAP